MRDLSRSFNPKSAWFLAGLTALILHFILLILIFWSILDETIKREMISPVLVVHLSPTDNVSNALKIPKMGSVPQHSVEKEVSQPTVSNHQFFHQENFLQLLHDKLQARLVYPEQAEVLHLSGEVMLCFRIAKTGHLVDLKACPASDFSFFNDAALLAARSIVLSANETQGRSSKGFRVKVVFSRQ